MAHRAPVPGEENSALVVGRAVSLLPKNWPFPPPAARGEPLPQQTEVQRAFLQAVESAANLRLDGDAVKTLRQELEELRPAK